MRQWLRVVPLLLLAVLAFVATLYVSGRREAPLPSGTASVEASPNASILPQPLATKPTQPDAARSVATDLRQRSATPVEPPRHAREDVPLTDVPVERPAPSSSVRVEPRPPTTNGLFLTFTVGWPGRPVSVKNRALADDRRPVSAPKVLATVAPHGRALLEIGGAGLSLPKGAQIGARADLLSYVLLWPEGARYRILPQGTVRALWAERRADVTPLAAPSKVEPQPPGRFQAIATRRELIDGQLAQLALEQVDDADAGLGGPLVCRWLLELAGLLATPTGPCRPDSVPVRADFTWKSGGKLELHADELKRVVLALDALRVPPPRAVFDREHLPLADKALLGDEAIARLVPDAAPSSSAAAAAPPGLLARNDEYVYRQLLIDGVPVALVAPRAEVALRTLPSGVHSIAWADLLGSPVQARQQPVPSALPPEPEEAAREP